MNGFVRILFCAAAVLLAVQVHASNLQMWYTAPGTNNMTQGLLIGNGRMGAVIPGGVAEDTIILNEDSLWAGTANLSGGYSLGPTASFGDYEMFGSLVLNLPSHTNPTGYVRALNIGTGIATVDYTNNGVEFHRELFCSAPDQVLVMQLTANTAASYTGSLQLADYRSTTTSNTANGLMFSGALANGEQYEAQLVVTNNGGTVSFSGGVVNFTNCNSLTVIVALGTSYVPNYSLNYLGNNPHTNVLAQVTAAAAKSFSTLETAHTNDFEALFNRVSIWLGNAPASRTNLPTDQRITANAPSDDDPWMEQLMFQYGRYLMISSSRGGLPMNLQGLWNDNNNPSWTSWGDDYHSDINVEMMYWEAEVANLPECFLPFVNWLQSQIPAWRYVTTNASTSINNGGYGYGFGGTNGWTTRTSDNLWGGQGWNWIQSGNAWYDMHLWEHYAFSGDTNYLLSVYPILKETCQFWQQHLQPLGANTNRLPVTILVATNGWSPEHGPWENGVSFDQELIGDVFNNYQQACAVLNTDAVYSATVSNLQANLLVPGIGPWGELREWLYYADIQPPNSGYDHRHTSHLVGVYPGHQFTPDQTPLLAAAAKVGLLARGDTGDSATEWAHAWRTALFARLLDPVDAHHKLALYCGTIYPNLIGNLNSIAQWDGSCGITAGIAEMLLQSHEGRIALLPALPTNWPAGSVTGLRARGGFTVDVFWTNGLLTSATIHSANGTNCVIQYGSQTIQTNIPLGGSVPFTPQNLTGRLSTNFNQSWKFALGDYSGAQTNNYDDGTWNNVGLPHSFSQPYFLWPQFYTGYGWYRKHFTVQPQWAGKRVFLEFQAAFQDAQVYVNGTLVNEHLGGYTGFSYDITPYVVIGDNVVAVRLNNNWNAQLAPRAGDHTFSGGIYRDVNLVVTDPLHVTWYGTFVTTPTLATNNGASSTVNIQTEIANNNTNSVSCTVETDILDTNSNLVTTVSSTQTLPANSTNIFNQTTPAVANPQLWSPTNAYLYRAVTTVFNNGTNVDTFNTTFGFRWFTWSATNGFTLNGSHLYFHGADVHQDHAGWGDGVADSALFRDVQMVKQAGFNFIRGSHYPKAPAFADACDQLGVCFWSENCFWGLGGATGEGSWSTASSYPNNAGDQAPFVNSVTNSLAAMIRIHRNHPSIVAWSMCNEPFFTSSGTYSLMQGLLTNEVNLTHQLDPTRPAAIGGAQRGDANDGSRIDVIGDVAGYNGDGATLSIFQNDGTPSMVTEYGSTEAIRPGSFTPGWGSLVLSNNVPIEYPWRSGQAIWCMFDHGSIAAAQPSTAQDTQLSLETMGIVDYFRLPKEAWYYYRNLYAGVPPPAWPTNGTPAALQLTASTTNLTAVDGTQDALITVTVLDTNGVAISNNVPVTLTITSGPGEFPTGTNITFLPPSSNPQSDISILNGQAAIEFRTYYSGTTVITATSPGLTSTNIIITSQGSPAFVLGVSPTAGSIPYSRYTGTNSTGESMTLALSQPAGASSTDSGLPSYANDGNTNTVWQAASTDTNAWWQVSLQANYAVNMIQLTFPTNANYRYTISVSPDGNTWTQVVNQSDTTSTDQTQRSVGNFGSTVSWVQINFTNMPAGLIPALAEFSVGGAPTLTFKTNQLGGTIIGTLGSYNNIGNTREMAMDWNTNTFFDGPNSSNGSNCWAGLDLGTGISTPINQINYCPRAGYESRMVGGVFQGANQPDFSDAVTLFTVSTQPTAGVLTSQVITNQSPFRYVRYFSPVNGWGNIAEEEFYTVTTPPNAPTSVSASPGNGQVSLSWSPVAGATSYNVKRSLTSGSGYGTVTNVVSTSFVNTGLANSTTYYFVVSATNSYGESANSSEVSATPSAGYATNFFWTGAVNGNWDTATANWRTNGLSAVFRDGGAVVFDDTALSNTTVNLSATRTPAAVTVNSSSLAYTISGSAIAGTGSLTKSGLGTLTLSGANTYGGGTTNSGGTIILSASTIGSAGAVTSGPLGTGTLALNGGAISPDNSAIRTNANAIVVVAGTTNTLGSTSTSAGKNFSLTGALTGSGTLQNSSATPAASYSFFLLGDLSQFTGTMIYNGVTSGNGANWRMGTSGSTSDLSQAAVVLNGGNGKNFGFTDNSSNIVLNIGSLAGNGYFQGSYFNSGSGAGNVLRVGCLNTNATFSGQVGVANANMANFSLVKVGTGTQVLSGASIYTGQTTVSNGELVVSTAFTGNGNVLVGSGATFGVTNVSSGSALVSNLTAAVGSALEFQNVASTTTPLIAASNVTINGGCTGKVTGTGGLAAGNSYPLISYSGTLSGSFANLQLQMPYGWRGTLVNSANQIVLANVATVATTPPPLSFGVSNGLLQINWPSDHIGWRLEAQTNNLDAGLGTNWVTVPSSINSNLFSVPVGTTNGSVFFRLAYP
jgi:autotransporter-associated beta strand protein